jgi:hypothetical protein
VKRLVQIPVIVVFKVSKIAGKSIQKSEKISRSICIQVSVIFLRLSNAHCQFHVKTFLKKSIISLKILVTHLTVSVIALKLDLTNSTTNNKAHLTVSLKIFRRGISIGSNCLYTSLILSQISQKHSIKASFNSIKTGCINCHVSFTKSLNPQKLVA